MKKSLWAQTKKILSALFLAVLIPLLVIDSMPETSLFHKATKEKIDKILDVSGLWQGSWTLFSPSPDRLNVKVSWHCELSDQTTLIEESPRWVDLNIWQKWTHFRYMEYFDNVRTDANKGAWSSFAKYVKQKCESSLAASGQQEVKVVAVQIYRHWAVIPEYTPLAPMAQRPLVDFQNSYRFVEERY